MTKKTKKKNIELSAMPTPNPNAIKFLPDMTFFDIGTIDFPDSQKAKNSPLPRALFEVEGVESVMVGFNFVTVIKRDSAQWETLLESVRNTIISVLENQVDVVDTSLIQEAHEKSDSDDAITVRIKEILDTEIRPAIALDGGDVQFKRFEDGIVTLFLQGACSTCPSATVTLKMGIENRLREEFPDDITDVVQEF